MRDKTHFEQIERWARYVKENPDKWKSILKPFIDSQIIMSRRFYEKLARTPNGMKKINKLRKLNQENLEFTTLKCVVLDS